MPLPFPPPLPPPPNSAHFPANSTPLPDFLLTALSLFVLFSSSKHHHSAKSVSTANRRFLRPITTVSTMSQNLNPRSGFTAARPFPTPQSLSDWLRPRLHSDSFAAWGTKPGTKNVHNLWLELADGETSLVDTTPPVRNLEVVSVRVIGLGNRVLIESHQELSDGSVRYRNRPLSEKLKAGEDFESAVKRAVREELGSIMCCSEDVDFDKIVKILPGSYERKVEERVSLSYPGLPACYVMHMVDAVVEGLPEDEFTTEEQNEYGESGMIDKSVAMEAVSVKKHFWRWVSRDSL